jgi:hypothetical protein
VTIYADIGGRRHMYGDDRTTTADYRAGRPFVGASPESVIGISRLSDMKYRGFESIIRNPLAGYFAVRDGRALRRSEIDGAPPSALAELTTTSVNDVLDMIAKSKEPSLDPDEVADIKDRLTPFVTPRVLGTPTPAKSKKPQPSRPITRPPRRNLQVTVKKHRGAVRTYP